MTGWSLPVASFWAGEDLSFVEQMVIQSYLDQGCDFTLYLGNPVKGIPQGVKTAPASDILPMPGFLSDPPSRKQLAVWSDLFRVALLARQQVIWVDLDAYCLRPFDTPGGYAFGLNDEGGVLSGVLALPLESPALHWLADFVSQDQIIPPWADPDWAARKARRGQLGPADLPWGDTGPRALTHALKLGGEFSHAAPREVYYPLFRQSLTRIWTPHIPDDRIAGPQTASVHIFGFTKRFLWTHCKGVPPAHSWLDRAARRHGIDPAAAPAKGELLT